MESDALKAIVKEAVIEAVEAVEVRCRSLTAVELAERLGLCEMTIRRLTALGMPSERYGAAVRYDLSAVKSWAAKRPGRLPASRKEK